MGFTGAAQFQSLRAAIHALLHIFGHGELVGSARLLVARLSPLLKSNGTIPVPPLYSPLTDLPCQKATPPENATGLRLLRSPDSAKNNEKDSQIVEYRTFLPLYLRPLLTPSVLSPSMALERPPTTLGASALAPAKSQEVGVNSSTGCKMTVCFHLLCPMHASCATAMSQTGSAKTLSIRN